MTSLYNIAAEYLEAMEFFESCEELDKDTIHNTLEGMQFLFKDKVINIAAYIKNTQFKIESIKNARKELEARQRKMEKLVANLSDYLWNNMSLCNIAKIESPLFDIKVVNNPASVCILDEELIPSFYINVKEEKHIDKTAIKKAIDAGEEVPGAVIVHSQRISIK